MPIYQTVAYAFDSAEHGAALFNLEAEGYRYTRISNPTTAVLERRVAALEGGLEAMCVATGQAAVNYAVLNLTGMGSNIVSLPQLYGTTHTLFAHILPEQGVRCPLCGIRQPEAIERLIDGETRAIYCESVGNPAGNICDIEALAQLPPGTASRSWWITPWPRRCCCGRSSMAPISSCIRSPSSWAGMAQRSAAPLSIAGTFPWWAHAAAFHVLRARPLLSRPRLYRTLRTSRLHRPLPQPLSAHHRAVLAPLTPFCCCRESRRSPCASSVTWRTAAAWPNSCTAIHALPGSITPAFPTVPTTLWRRSTSADGLLADDFGCQGRLQAAIRFYDALKLINRLVNLGDAKSLACHPASTTHRQMSPKEQDKAGVRPEMIRLDRDRTY